MTYFDAEKRAARSKLQVLVDAIMLAYWGQATPARFAKAWDHACRILDQDRPTYSKLTDALEWLVEASKDDERVAKQLAA